MNLWKITTLALALALALVVGTSTLRADRQPHMQNALAALQTARAELQTATHDKGGHRVKALSAVDLAIDHVKRGIAFDNRRAELPKPIAP
jgi:hypothetical protein